MGEDRDADFVGRALQMISHTLADFWRRIKNSCREMGSRNDSRVNGGRIEPDIDVKLQENERELGQGGRSGSTRFEESREEFEVAMASSNGGMMRRGRGSYRRPSLEAEGTPEVIIHG